MAPQAPKQLKIVIEKGVRLRRNEKADLVDYVPGDIVEGDANVLRETVANNKAVIYDGPAKHGDNIAPKKDAEKKGKSDK